MPEVLKETSPIKHSADPSVDCELGMVGSLVAHWPEYSMEAAGLALFMFLVCVYATLLQHPASPMRHALIRPIWRRLTMGVAVGTTLASIVETPWGRQSGGHFNPAITVTFLRLGKVALWDTVFYVLSQFFGATFGAAIASYALRGRLRHEAVRSAMITPGFLGETGAFAAELLISLSLMMAVLFFTNRRAIAPFAPFLIGAMYALYITFESPLSGMSMNPARTFGSAFLATYWHAIWIYFVAPLSGMLIGAEIFIRLYGKDAVYCAKLLHAKGKRCIFSTCSYSRPIPMTM